MKYAPVLALLVLAAFAPLPVVAQQVTVVDMIPDSSNGEFNNDSEPNLAIDPATPAGSSLCASGFCDITLRFAGTSDQLYVSSLTADNSSKITYQVNRFSNVFSNPPSAPVLLEKRSGTTDDPPDQPYIQATTTLGGEGTSQDRVFVGLNDARVSVQPQTATVDVFANAAASPPPGVASQVIEDSMPPANPGRDGSAVRTAHHSSGVVYPSFYSPTSSI